MVFDVDGTLVDTNYLHVMAWSRAFRDAGHDIAMAAIHRRIGMGSDKLLADVIGEHRAGLDEAHSAHFGRLTGEIRAFPRAGDLLRAVAAQGLRVVLATSSKPEQLDSLLRALDADDVVSEVVSAGDVDATKPDPDVFAAALVKAGLLVEESVAVGDTVWDIEAAGRCGLRCIALRSGGIDACELERAGAVAVYDDPGHLLDHLDAVSARGHGSEVRQAGTSRT